MKIPFDIKYRPQIESGEYKVETRDGNPIRVLAWDLPYDFPIATAEFTKDNRVIVESYSADGWVGYGEKENNLVIVTPEEELTEFEKAVDAIYESCGVKELRVKEKASKLLSLAKKELIEELESRERNAFYYGLKNGKEQGKDEALKDLPRWERLYTKEYADKIQDYIIPGKAQDNRLAHRGFVLKITDLEKLPGFKEGK